MATSEKSEATDQLFGLGTLMSELKRLETKAMSQGFLIAATLIGAAAEAVADEMVEGIGTSTLGDRSETKRQLEKLRNLDPQSMQ
ncbi:MAG: hypothetical protein QNI93_09190 [Kiloniellales bacterium]|nr:hypothetical protein [Kiloniellales bacterium]MDJ0982355.1 hypothetical protein [Kiloniellales bacterium]